MPPSPPPRCSSSKAPHRLWLPPPYPAREKTGAAGGNVTGEAGPVKGGSTVIAIVTDPDGYKIELIQRAEGAGGAGLR